MLFRSVEDCIDKIPNRYELLMVAAQRAKDIAAGSPITVSRDNDKNSVISLREIAEETVSIEELQKSLVMGLQKYVEVEEPEEEELEILAAEKELSELDDQFTGLLLDTDISDAMQIHSEDEDMDLEADAEMSFDDEDSSFEDGLDLGGDFGDLALRRVHTIPAYQMPLSKTENALPCERCFQNISLSFSLSHHQQCCGF